MNRLLIPMDYPDPDIIRVEDMYVMVSTTMHFFPGGPVLYSKDLKKWNIASYLFDTLDDTPKERMEASGNIYGHGMWAPCIRYYKDRYFVAFVSHKEDKNDEDFTHLFVSDSIFGPWEHRRIKGYYHDCSLLFDDDEKVYVVHGNTNIRITELSKDLKGPLEGGLDGIIVKDCPKDVILGYEGSHFYKINGKYYLTLIHWPKKTGVRTESVFVSERIDGPYTGKDVLSDNSFCNQGIAQGGLVDTPEGEWYSVMFRDSGAVGRMPVICDVMWENDFPVFDSKEQKDGEKSDSDFLKCDDCNLFEAKYFSSEESENSEILPAWQWNHKPDDKLWKLTDKNNLYITTGKISANPVNAVNVLTQRMIYPKCSAEVTVDTSQIKDGDYAGLLILQGNYCMVGITRKEGDLHLVTLENNKKSQLGVIGSEDNSEGEISVIKKTAKECVTFKVSVDFTDMRDEAYMYVKEDEKWVEVGNGHKLHFGLDHFTGARVGLCVYSTKNAGGTAHFSNISIEME